jgi:hypothetical protein
VDRGVAAKLIGYSGTSGPANAALAALASYGLVERAGKGELRVTSRARSILHALNDQERIDGILAAAFEPDLFRELRDRFPEIKVPPEDGVITYLNRQGFNATAVKPAAKAFLQTMTFVEELGGSESNGVKPDGGGESLSPSAEAKTAAVRGGAKVGDLVQWESHGALQLSQPQRVRWVSEDGQWLALEGSETGIPMNEVIIEPRTTPPAPPVPPSESKRRVELDDGYQEWFRAKVGAGKQIQIWYQGDDDIGPKEIQKLIDILAAQKTALED